MRQGVPPVIFSICVILLCGSANAETGQSTAGKEFVIPLGARIRRDRTGLDSNDGT